MASLKFMVLLSIGLQGYSLTSALNTGDLQSFSDATGTSDESVFQATKQTGDVCQDCTQIFELLADLLSNTDIETKMIEGIDRVCDLLPGPSTAAKFCREEVEKMLPLAIAFITSAVKPEEACKIMGLCQSCDKQEKMLSYFVKEALQAAVTSDNKQPTTHCSFCVFLLKTLEDLLPKERTEALVMKLLEEICKIMPAPYQDQCEDIINKVTKTVLDAILSFATPKTICTLLHLCKGQQAAPVDPCILITYRCRDVRTALRCGTLLYCQRFVWRPLDYNSL
ncbi:prosaposin isoform X1 [Solea solea]|uniref:prosaposin isoform X1 n=1 Tax=Solea solea TaxID=90069 RepID=UPI00272C5B43|nr:prosaposin isoform X1 [Solea solea]XP_058472956.1 prosaposin isoform X1 [Solea solea]